MTILQACALVAVLVLFPASVGGVDRPPPKTPGWSFEGPFGLYDRDGLRRGYEVYAQVCASCHGMRQLSYRNLAEPGGPEFTPEEAKNLIGGIVVQDGPDETGDFFERPARLSDTFVSPFPNDQAARASNGGALPPDLSLIVKAREGGSDYVYSLLTGYTSAPADFALAPGQHYNPYFSSEAIAMAPPLTEGLVDYEDKTSATVEQMSHDVVMFLSWAAEPKMEQRKRIGFQVLIFLIILTALMYAVTQRIWNAQRA